MKLFKIYYDFVGKEEIGLRLHELRYETDLRRKRKRVGRGMGSGLGKTSGKGHKGQKARSGGGVRHGFEGGQMPLQRRVPKRGFNNIFAKNYAIINVGDLARFKAGSKIDFEKLRKEGLVRKNCDGFKVLGDGDLSKKLHVIATKFSKLAKSKIESAQGKAEVK